MTGVDWRCWSLTLLDSKLNGQINRCCHSSRACIWGMQICSQSLKNNLLEILKFHYKKIKCFYTSSLILNCKARNLIVSMFVSIFACILQLQVCIYLWFYLCKVYNSKRESTLHFGEQKEVAGSHLKLACSFVRVVQTTTFYFLVNLFTAFFLFFFGCQKLTDFVLFWCPKPIKCGQC